MRLHTIYTTYEVTDENDDCLLEIVIRICFTKSKYYPATQWVPPEGGELEIHSIEMEDTPNKWQILTTDDDLYEWAIDWFDNNSDLAHDVVDNFAPEYEYDREY